MTSANRILILLLTTVGLAAVFWFLILSPKREEIATLDQQIEQLHASIAESQRARSIGEEAKAGFAEDYSQLVTLGKAVPDGDEQGALLVQLNRLGIRNSTFFSSIVLEASGAEPPSVPEPEPSATVAPSVSEPPSDETAPGTTGNPVPATPTATESTVAALPIGANVGSAAFATLPYKLAFSGNFFKLADFIGSLDGQVTTDRSGQIQVNGRLMTIDGFALNPSIGGDLTRLDGNFAVTTFVTPAAEGATAGATPTGPGTAPSLVSSAGGSP